MYKILWKFKKRADVFFLLFLKGTIIKKTVSKKSSQGRQASALAKEPG